MKTAGLGVSAFAVVATAGLALAQGGVGGLTAGGARIAGAPSATPEELLAAAFETLADVSADRRREAVACVLDAVAPMTDAETRRFAELVNEGAAGSVTADLQQEIDVLMATYPAITADLDACDPYARSVAEEFEDTARFALPVSLDVDRRATLTACLLAAVEPLPRPTRNRIAGLVRDTALYRDPADFEEVAMLAPDAARTIQACLDAADPFAQIAPFIEEGTSEPWTVTRSDAEIRLYNPEGAGAIRHYRLPIGDDTPLGERTISVVLDLPNGDANSHSGLLYAYAAPDSYYMFLVDGAGGAAVWQRTPDGVARVAAVSTEELPPGTAVRGREVELTVVERGGIADFYANGDFIGDLGFAEMGTGQVGIVAWGAGDYVFRGFLEGVVDENTPPPPPA